MNRRNFIEFAGRGTLMGALVLGCGVLIFRRQVVRESSCSANLQCKNCRKLAKCELPEAEMERNDG